MSDTESSQHSKSRSSLLKALGVLECFSPAEPELNLTRLAELSELPVSTVHRYVRDLIEWGAIERSSRDSYRLGLRLWEMGSMSQRGSLYRELAVPILEDIVAATDFAASLWLLDNHDVVMVEGIIGKKITKYEKFARGRRNPALATGAGRVLLAHAPSSLEVALSGPLARYTPYTVTDPDELRHAVLQAKQAGYSIAIRQLHEEVSGVSAPVFRGCGQVVAALSIILPDGDMELRAVAALAVAGARSISRALAPMTPKLK